MGRMGRMGAMIPILLILPIPPRNACFPPRGDYQTLLSFQKAEVIYDLTFCLAHKFFP